MHAVIAWVLITYIGTSPVVVSGLSSRATCDRLATEISDAKNWKCFSYRAAR